MKSNDAKISVVIMTLNAENYIEDFIVRLLRQTLKPDEIIVVDSESNDATIEITSKFPQVKIVNIKRENFDHGGTRDLAFKVSTGDIVLFFSQDAVIANDDYISNMVLNFEEPLVAMAYGRQVAKLDARSYEEYIRLFNYPKSSRIKSLSDMEILGIKCFYMSDVSSAYRRETYFELGGFEKQILTNEDMLIATKAIMAGYKVVYDAKSVVYHSHNYSFMQELRRNFDVGCFLKIYDELYGKIKVTSEGKRLVIFVMKRLIKNKKFLDIFRFMNICFAKLLGNKLGKNFKHLPKKVILFLSQNKLFWKKYFNR